MIRIAGIGVLLGTIWLANMAVPGADSRQRLDRSIGISLQGNPGARALNSAPAQYGRLPSEIFGSGDPDVSPKPFVIASANRSPLFGSQPKTAIASPTRLLVPLPTPKPLPAHIPVAELAAGGTPVSMASTITKPTDATGTVFVTALPADWTTAVSPVSVATVTRTASTAAATQLSVIKSDALSTSRLSVAEQHRVTRHIQRELQRVGCYSGAIDGIWGDGSRSAMQAFAQVISASIPTDAPDYIALMLVEKYDARACQRRPGQPSAIQVELRPRERINAKPTAIIAGLSRPISASKFTTRRASLGGPARRIDAAVPRPALPARNSATRRASARKATQPPATARSISNRPVRTARIAQRHLARPARIRRQQIARRRIARRSTRRASGFSRRGRRSWVRRAFSNDR